MDVTHRSLPALLTSVLVIFFPFGALGEESMNEPQPVIGVIGGDVSFRVEVSPGKQVEKIEWDIISPVSGKPYQLCVFRGWALMKTKISTWLTRVTDLSTKLSIIIQDNEFVNNLMMKYMFGHRLEMADNTTLKIRKVTKEDAAIYNARVWLNAEQFEDHIFNVTLYYPSPAPKICYDNLIKTAEVCNVTLECRAYEQGRYNIFWEKVNALHEIPFSGNGRYLYVSWRKDSPHSMFTCLVQNLVEKKRASFDLLKICQDDDGHKGSHGPNMSVFWIIILSCLPIVACVLMMACVLTRNKKSSLKSRDIPPVEYRPPPENPMMNLPVMMSGSTEICPPSHDPMQVDQNGMEGSLCSEPPAYDSLFDCTASDSVTHHVNSLS